MKLFKATRSFLVFFLTLCGTNIASAKSVSDKVKGTIEDVSKSLKKDVDKLEDDFASIQHYLDNYSWKGIIQEKATSGIVTLNELRLNSHHRVTAVRPDSVIDADVVCYVDPEQSSVFEIYRVVIGFKGVGPQVSICNASGASPGKKLEGFKLRAPKEPGVYEVRFRTVSKVFEYGVLDSWEDESGQEPDASTTIGIIVVKS